MALPDKVHLKGGPAGPSTMAKRITSTPAPTAAPEAHEAHEAPHTSTIPAAPAPQGLITGLGEPVDVSTLPSSMIAYLLQYGMSKSLQDAASGTKAKAEAAFTRAKASGTEDKEFEGFAGLAGLDLDHTLTTSSPAAFADAVVKAQKSARLAAIVAGTVGQSRGRPATGLGAVGREMVKIAGERIRIAAKAKGVKLPTGADYQDRFLTPYMAKHEDALKVEAERRLAATGLGEDFDLDALMG